MAKPTRVLLHLGPGRRQALDPADVFFLEAQADNTLIRMRRARRVEDVRSLGTLEAVFRPFGFVRISREAMVNPEHVHQVRQRGRSGEWELKLRPPVNRVLPVGRSFLAKLWAAFG